MELPRRQPRLLPLLLLLGCLGASRAFYSSLSPFTAIQVAAALDGTLVIAPDSATYDISMRGPPELEAAFTPAVTAGVLTVSVDAAALPEETLAAGNFTVRMPRGQLTSLTAAGDGDFEANGLVATRGVLTLLATGAGATSILNLPSTAAIISSSGAGNLTVQGSSLSSVQYSSTGVGSTFIGGISGRAFVNLAGQGSLYVMAGQGTFLLGGQATGTGKVFYQGGVCSVQGVDPNTCVPSTIQVVG